MIATMAVVVARYADGAIEITGWGWLNLYGVVMVAVLVATAHLKRRGDK